MKEHDELELLLQELLGRMYPHPDCRIVGAALARIQELENEMKEGKGKKVVDTKAHSIEVTVTSKTGGVVNQVFGVEEFADDVPELMYKNFVLAGAVYEAVNAAMAEMASQYVEGGKKAWEK